MKFYIRTLGCKMNQLDSARISAALQGAGHQLVAEEGEAEYVLVNSCTVTAEAERKSRQIARAAGREAAQVAVMGCGPRVAPVQWHEQVPKCNIFNNESELLNFFNVNSEENIFPLTSRTRLPVAIQQGCDNRCTFCITRIARGAHHSLPVTTVIEQIRQAEAHGVNEVVLTGINLAAWGTDNSNNAAGARLHSLLEAILTQTEMPRIRLSSLGPQYLHEGFFELFANERLQPYLHLSLQSGSDSVLARMDRGHGTEEVLRIARLARQARPEMALAADVIAGFPGESAAEHSESCALIREAGLAKLHVFPYSPREGTPAAKMPGQLEKAEKKQRTAELRSLGNELRRQFIASQMGKRQRVLVERRESGLSGNYIRIHTPGIAEGEIIEVVLSESNLAELNKCSKLVSR